MVNDIMPVVRGEEIRVTEEDVNSENIRGRQPPDNQVSRRVILERVTKFIVTTNEEEVTHLTRVLKQRRQDLGMIKPVRKPKFLDRALLYIYLNVTPFIIALVVVLPLVVWTGWAIFKIQPLLIPGTKASGCPPACGWLDIAFWLILGGIALLVTFVFSYILRDRLLKARKAL